MGLWNSLCNWFNDSTDIGGDLSSSSMDCGCDINPATGLPMIGDCGGIDVGGSPFGTDLHHDDWSSSSDIGIDTNWDSTSSFDDSFSGSSSWDNGSIGSMWDD